MYRGRTPQEYRAKDRKQGALIVMAFVIGGAMLAISHNQRSGTDISKLELELKSPILYSSLRDSTTNLVGVSNGPKVVLKRNGEVLATGQADQKGNFNFPVETKLLVGVTNLVAMTNDDLVVDKIENLSFDIIAVDKSNENDESAESIKSTTKIDTKLAITSHSNGDELRTGRNVVEGTGIPGTTVALRLNQNLVSRAKVGPDGTWTAIFSLERAEEKAALAASTANPIKRTPPIQVSVNP